MWKLWANIYPEIKGPLVSLLVSAITLGIAVNAGTDLIVQRIGRPQTMALALIATIVIIFLARPIRMLGRVLRSLFQARVEEMGGPVQSHRGLIVMASPGAGISSAEGAIRYHLRSEQLEHCWLMTGGAASEASGGRLIEKLVNEGIPMARFRNVRLDPLDVNNPEAVYRRINAIYEQGEEVGLREDEIIGDYTGGTKSMTAGMILACASPRRHLQFMKPRRSTDDGRAEEGTESEPVAVHIRFELIPLSRGE